MLVLSLVMLVRLLVLYLPKLRTAGRPWVVPSLVTFGSAVLGSTLESTRLQLSLAAFILRVSMLASRPCDRLREFFPPVRR